MGPGEPSEGSRDGLAPGAEGRRRNQDEAAETDTAAMEHGETHDPRVAGPAAPGAPVERSRCRAG